MTRSQMMGAVHSEDTKPEVKVRRALFQAGFRYRLHRRDLPGTPDIFVQKYGVAIRERLFLASAWLQAYQSP